MNPIFVEAMNEKFPNQFKTESVNNHLFIVFPAKNFDFGDVDIQEEYQGSYIVTIGKFSHQHFDEYEGTDDEMATNAAIAVADFLENLFADRIICYGSHEGGGGCYWKGDEENSWADDDDDLFVWSGIYRKATPTE